MKIIFMGTPDFAKESLKGLIDEKYNIVGVVTNPDKPKGRNLLLVSSPVKQLALEYNISVYQPNSLKTDEVYELIKNLQPDLIVVVAYGKILPKNILDIPKYGCINVHGSLLPKYRGASPIQTAIINGDSVTGITTMFMDEGMDTGDIILQKELRIDDDDTSETLYEKLAVLGKELLVKTVKCIESGQVERKKQEGIPSYCKIFKKEDGLVSWDKSAIEINNLVRGLNPWPCAYMVINGKTFKLWKTKVLNVEHDWEVGKIIVCDEKQGLQIATANGLIDVIEVQAEGKKRMNIKDFLRGNKL